MALSFARLVATSAAVGSTRARSQKIAALAELLREAEPHEIETVVAFLIGEPRHGKIGVGWATLRAASQSARPAESGSLTVTDVDLAIGTVAGLGGPGSVAARQSTLVDVLNRATADEGDFLVRLLGGELRQGALAGIMVDAVAKAAAVPVASVRRANMLAGDLPSVARIALVDGESGLADVHLRLFCPVLPMLAATSASVAEAVEACGLSSVEWKLDGVRLQVHRSDDDVRLYTRNLNDVTDRLPAVAEVVRGFPASQLMLDGEVLGLGDDDRPDAFQDTMSRFGRRTGPDAAASAGLVIRFFDVMHVDGADLLDRPLVDRIDVLERVVGPYRIPGTLTADPAAGQAVLDDALANGHEGVMVKAATSPYEAGRRGQAWRKVKPVLTFDLVVLAAEWGSGRRRGWLSNLHLGARDPTNPGQFVMVGKTFKGLTDELLTWQTEQFLAREMSRDGHVVHVRPELVVEIALDGVQASTRYLGGVALRFARVRRYRPDKSPAEADTIDSVHALLGRHHPE